MNLATAWSVEELRHQVGASEHMLALTRREYDANPTPERQEAVEEAALWLGRFRDLLSDRLRAERRMKERIAIMPAHTGTVVVTATELRDAARQLAASIEAGEYDALSPSMRFGLRHLTCQQLKWADALDPDRAPAVTADDGTVVRFRKPEPVRAVEEHWR